jgi:hypothetical protein
MAVLVVVLVAVAVAAVGDLTVAVVVATASGLPPQLEKVGSTYPTFAGSTGWKER